MTGSGRMSDEAFERRARETWAVCTRDSRYQVSTLGRVKSCARGPERILRGTPNRTGYLRVTIVGRSCMVHVLVLEAFVGPRPTGLGAAHIDGNRLNNCLSNLRWATQTENEADKVRHGTKAIGSRVNGARLVEAQIPAIRERLALGLSSTKVGREFGVSGATILRIANNVNWRHVPALLPAPQEGNGDG